MKTTLFNDDLDAWLRKELHWCEVEYRKTPKTHSMKKTGNFFSGGVIITGYVRRNWFV